MDYYLVTFSPINDFDLVLYVIVKATSERRAEVLTHYYMCTSTESTLGHIIDNDETPYVVIQCQVVDEYLDCWMGSIEDTAEYLNCEIINDRR